MKTRILLFSVLAMLAVSWQVSGQVNIINETLRTGAEPSGWTSLNVTYATSAGGYANLSGSTAILETSVIDLSSYTNVQLTFDVAKFGSGGDGPITVQISDDGGATFTAQTFNSPTPTNSTYQTSGPTLITATGSDVVIRFVTTSSASAKRLRDLLLTGTLSTATPDITISDNSQPAAGNINQGDQNTILSAVEVAVTTADATLNQFDVTISGTFDGNDVDDFQLFYNGVNNFGGATQIGNVAGTSPVSFTGLSQLIADGATGYFWVVADISAAADAGNTLTAQQPSLTFAGGNVTNNSSAAGTQTILAVTPTVVLADNGGPVALGNVDQNTTANTIASFQLTASTANADFTDLTINTTGSYLASDVENLQLWYSVDNTLNTEADVSLSTMASPGTAGSQVFPSFSQIVTNGATGYFFITIDVPCDATASNTIVVSSIANTDLTFTGTVNKSGSSSVSGIQTIQAITPSYVTGEAASAGNTTASIAWTNPACLDDVIIVAHTSSIGGTPTGTYTVNSQSYTDAGNDMFPGGGVVVYSGTSSPQTVTDLQNGVQYFFKIFVRKGSNYSSGVEVTATPNSTTIIDFDTDSNWTAGSGSITSYNTGHTYVESNWTFTGGPALRNGNSAQDGFPAANGAYSWRLQNNASVVWTATYTATLGSGESFSGFGFSARRWDDTPSPDFLVEYSADGGSNWTTATSFGTNGIIDNDGLNNQSDFVGFSQAITSPAALNANQMIVRVSAQSAGERIMIDDFTFSTSTAAAAPLTYTHTSGGGWDTDPSGVSSSIDTIKVVSGNASISSGTSCNVLTVSPGATLDLGANTLTVNDTAYIQVDATGYAQVKGDVSGVAKWQSHLTSSNSAKWFNVAIPMATDFDDVSVSSGMLQAAGDSATTNVWFYDPSTVDNALGDAFGSWKPAASLSSASTSDIGFTVYLGQPYFGTLPITMTATGALRDGNISVGITNNLATDYWNFIPNPYPSAIDWAEVYADNGDFPTFYVFDDDANQYYGYNAATPGAPTGGTSQQYIAPGQAFFVQGGASAANSISFDNDMRTVSQSPILRKGGSSQGLYLVVNGPANMMDYTFVGFVENGTDAKDQQRDGGKLGNYDLNFFTELLGEKYMYKFVDSSFTSKQIPVSFKAVTEGSFSIDLDLYNINSGWSISLEDKVTNAIHNLKNGAYNFTHTIGNQEDRFVLHINKAAVGVEEVAANNIYAYVNSNALFVNLEQLGGKVQVALYDMNGRIMLSQNVETNAVVELSLNDLAAGLYIVKVQQEGKIIHTQKITK